MIIRKPYAFIIKHFKAIHLIILGCLIFSISNVGGIVGLVNTLINSRTYTYSGADVYIVKTVYPFLIVALGLSGILFWLLRLKKKPVGLYIGLVIYIIGSIVFYVYTYSILGKIINEAVEIDTLSFIKDISTLVTLPGYVFIAICFVRGIGFNVKQFNFSKDIEELKIADKDSEEFELMVGQNNYKYMRTIRRTIREAKYYVLENMVAVTAIFLVLFLLLGFFGYRYYKQYMEKVKAQQVSTYDGISYVVNKAYITAYDQNGNLIREGSKFVVIDMSFNNVSTEKKVLDLDSFRLVNGELLYSVTSVYNSKFFDLGMPYDIGTEIPSDKMLDRTLVFEIPASAITTNYVLRYEYGLTSKKNDVLANYIKFDIKAQNIDTDPVNKTIVMDEELYSNVNNENEFHATFHGYGISENYNGKYVICDRKLKCTKYTSLISSNNYSKKTMLIVDVNAKIFEEAKFTKKFKDINEIFSNFGYITYDVYNKLTTEKINIVPNSSSDNKVFILADRNIKDSKVIKIELRFRNNTFTIPLKG